METTNKLTYLSTKFFTENKEEYRITVTVSLDDDCHNNMCDWSVTADIRRKNQRGQYKEYMGGCCHEADLALQSIWEHLAFSGFRDNEPNLSMASGNEIILEWNGSEMNANEIIDRMESVGYITPDDFIGG